MPAFREHCSAIVKDYVQTVLIIDDRAGLDHQVNTEEATELEDLDEDDILSIQETAETIEEAPETIEVVSEEEALSGTSSHQLNALGLTNAFYGEGIVAGLYQPQITEDEDPSDFAKNAERVASTSDILILDWMLKGSDSRYSKAIVKRITESDKESGGRIRAIIIYTGESNLSNLKDSLYEALDDESIDNREDFQLLSKNLMISFYNKPNSGGRPEREVYEEDLPAKALEEFEALIDGLVPAFAMKAAATIRHNTGRIISKFGSDLDTAYLAHRALLPKVEDSEVFMLENFVSYLRNILAINTVDKQTLDKLSISKWVTNKDQSLSKAFKYANKTYTFTKEQFLELISDGFELGSNQIEECLEFNHAQAVKFLGNKKNVLNLAQIINRTDGYLNVDNSSAKLAILTSFRRTFNDVVLGVELPYLTQGSIVYSIDSGGFLLCITPKCDTARVDSSRVFSFIKLNWLPTEKGSDLILPIEKSIVMALGVARQEILSKLNYDPFAENLSKQIASTDEHKKTIDDLSTIDKQMSVENIFVKSESSFFNLVHVDFNSDASNRVMPVSNANGSLEFSSRINDLKYIWIGDLEDLDTQDRVSNLVGNLNRIGTNEVEWLRRQYQ